MKQHSGFSPFDVSSRKSIENNVQQRGVSVSPHVPTRFPFDVAILTDIGRAVTWGARSFDHSAVVRYRLPPSLRAAPVSASWRVKTKTAFRFQVAPRSCDVSLAVYITRIITCRRLHRCGWRLSDVDRLYAEA